MGLYWFRVHTGQVLVALNRGNVASGAYSRLFELNFKVHAPLCRLILALAD
jgi:hypothetical protein